MSAKVAVRFAAASGRWFLVRLLRAARHRPASVKQLGAAEAC